MDCKGGDDATRSNRGVAHSWLRALSQPSPRSPRGSEKLRSRPDLPKPDREELRRRPWRVKRPAKLLTMDCLRGMLEVALDSMELGSRQASRFALQVKWPAKLQALDCLRLVLEIPTAPKRLGSP